MTEVERGAPEDDDRDGRPTLSVVAISVAAALLALLGVGAYYLNARGEAPTPGPEKPVARIVAARFTEIVGAVRVKRLGKFQWVMATMDTALLQSDLVRTDEGGAAKLTFVDGTVIDVGEGSLITIEEAVLDPTTRRRGIGMHITSGSVVYEKTSAGRAEVSTETVSLTQRGPGAGSLGVRETGETEVRIFDGELAEMTTKTGMTVGLRSGQAVRVDAAGGVGATVSLPAAPVLTAPAEDTEFKYVRPDRAFTRLAWASVEGARRYHVKIDHKLNFARPEVDQEGVKLAAMELQGLSTGRYYWKVAAQGPGGMAGPFSKVAAFKITKAAKVPGPLLELERLEARANVLLIKGRTRPGTRVTVKGQTIPVLEDGSFAEFIALETSGKHEVVLRATANDGGVTELKRSIVATF